MGRPHHLAEDQLFDCYTAEQAGESLDPRSAEHLADCQRVRQAGIPSCRASWTACRSDADAETDEVFPAGWQETQRQSILRRIEHLGHAARVISFPGRLVTQQMAKSVRAARVAVGGDRRCRLPVRRCRGRHVLRRAQSHAVNSRSSAPVPARAHAAGDVGRRPGAGRARYRRIPLGAGAGARRSRRRRS